MSLNQREISKSIRKGILWNSINSFARYGIVFIGITFLARLLTPEDYGIIGIMTVFISVADVLVDSGLGGAVVKKKNTTMIDYSTLTVYNLSVSVLLYTIFYTLAPCISVFYNKPILTDLLRLYSIVLLIHSITIAPKVFLTKNLRFKSLSLINLIASICGLVVAILLAYYGFGVYSLIWQYIVSSLASSILIFIVSHYKINLKFSYTSFKEQFSFGLNTTLANTLKAISDNIYANFIAKTSSIIQTGYYTQSSKLSTVPVSFLFSLIDNTYFPILSQEDDIKIFANRIDKLNIKTINFIILTFGFAIPISGEVIQILLGNQWIEAKLTLEILIISGMFISISNIGRNILKCLGMTSLILKVECRLFTLGVILLLISSFGGYYYIVCGFLLVSVVKSVYINYIAYLQIGLNIRDLFKLSIGVILMVIFSAFVACLVDYFNFNIWVSLFLKSFIYLCLVGMWIFKHKSMLFL